MANRAKYISKIYVHHVNRVTIIHQPGDTLQTRFDEETPWK